MTATFKARRFSMLQMIFAATVLLMIAKAFALRNNLTVDNWPYALGTQGSAELDDQPAGDDEGDAPLHDGDLAATEGE